MAVVSCDAQSNAGVHQVQVSEFAKAIDSLPNEIILDVRTPEETAQGTIPGALVINFYDTDFKAQLAKLDHSRPVTVYCRSGNRSGQSIPMLQEAGFTEIFELRGGFEAWKASGAEVKKP